MIKRITVTEGLYLEEQFSLDFKPTPKDFQGIVDAMAADEEERASPSRRERKKAEFLELLQAAGIQPPDTKFKNTKEWYAWLEKTEALPISSPERLAIEWLQDYEILKINLSVIENKGHDPDLMNRILFQVENLTRLEMWIFWLKDKEPKSGRTREALGRSGQKMSLTGKRNSETKLSKGRQLREARFKRMRELILEIGVDLAAAQVSIEGYGKAAAIKKQWNQAVASGEQQRLAKKKGT